MSLGPRRILSFHYLLYFAGMGIILPYLNLYFDRLGLSGEEIGVLAGARSLAAGVIPVFWGAAADRFGRRRGLFCVACAGSAVFFAPYLFTSSFYPLLAVTLLNCLFYTPIIAFLESFSMEVLGPEKKGYGRVRAWGSVSFIAVSLFLGRLLLGRDVSLILPILLGFSALQALAAPAMPRSAAGGRRKAQAEGVRSYFLRPRFLVFQLCAFLMLVSHGAYYGFFSIHLERMGFSRAFIGLAWAAASVAEIGVMVFSAKIYARASPRWVLPGALLVAAARWALMARAETGLEVMAIQLLHAVTYAAFHVGSILYTEELIPERARTLAQSVNNSVSYGLGMTAGIVLSGFIFDRSGGRAAFTAGAGVALFGAAVFFAHNILEIRRKIS